MGKNSFNPSFLATESGEEMIQLFEDIRTIRNYDFPEIFMWWRGSIGNNIPTKTLFRIVFFRHSRLAVEQLAWCLLLVVDAAVYRRGSLYLVVGSWGAKVNLKSSRRPRKVGVKIWEGPRVFISPAFNLHLLTIMV